MCKLFLEHSLVSIMRVLIPYIFLILCILALGCESNPSTSKDSNTSDSSDFLSIPSPLHTITPAFEIPEGTLPSNSVEYISLKVALYDSFQHTDAHLILLGNGESILIDYSDENFMESIIIPYLKQREIKQIDYLISTHFHRGSQDFQIGSGLDTLIEQFSIQRIYSVPLDDIDKFSLEDQQIIQQLHSRAIESGVEWNSLSPGDEIKLWNNNALLKVLSTQDGHSPENSFLNIRFQYEDFSVLFLKSTWPQEAGSLAKSGFNMASTILVLNHVPPDDYDAYASLLEAIAPAMIVIPYANRFLWHTEGNALHHQFIEKWMERSVPALAISWHGNISVRSDGKTASYYTDRELLLNDAEPSLSLFTDVSEEVGLSGFNSGASWGDYDGDGDEDYFAYTNNGDGTFTLNEQLNSVIENTRGISWGDLNGDGRLDLFGTYYQSLTVLHPYMEQQPDGTFIQKFQEYFEGLQIGTTINEWSGETNAWADIDGDGDLDLFVPWYHYQDPGGSFLFVNEYPILKKEEEIRGVAPPLDDNWPRVEGVHFVDLNEDGYLDFYTTSHLFLNDGQGFFTDHREEWGAPVTFDEGVYFLDVDVDGDFDLFLNSPKPYLLRNVGGKFEDISQSSGIESLEVLPFKWQHVFFDVDLDKDPDLIWIGQNPEIDVVSLYYLENQGAAVFAKPRLLGNIESGGLNFADYDLDGDLDLGIGGTRLWKNNWMENHPEISKPVRIKVVSPEGHFTEFGASVFLYEYDESGVMLGKQVQATDGGSGYMQQNQYPLYFVIQPDLHYEVEVSLPTGIERGPRRFRTTRMPGSSIVGKTVVIGDDGIHSMTSY